LEVEHELAVTIAATSSNATIILCIIFLLVKYQSIDEAGSMQLASFSSVRRGFHQCAGGA